MVCSKCGTHNVSGSKMCRKCGAILPASANTTKHSLGRSTSSPTEVLGAQQVNLANDFWMGVFLNCVGAVCATVIDKRKGTWAAFWGMIATGVLVVGVSALCRCDRIGYCGFMISIGLFIFCYFVGSGRLKISWLRVISP